MRDAPVTAWDLDQLFVCQIGNGADGIGFPGCGLPIPGMAGNGLNAPPSSIQPARYTRFVLRSDRRDERWPAEGNPDQANRDSENEPRVTVHHWSLLTDAAGEG